MGVTAHIQDNIELAKGLLLKVSKYSKRGITMLEIFYVVRNILCERPKLEYLDIPICTAWPQSNSHSAIEALEAPYSMTNQKTAIITRSRSKHVLPSNPPLT